MMLKDKSREYQISISDESIIIDCDEKKKIKK